MAVSISSLKTNLNTYIADASTDRISDAERYQYLTEATFWLAESLGNEHQDASFEFDYFDTVHEYKTTTSIPDLTEAVELRRAEDLNYYPFVYKSSREVTQEISAKDHEASYSIERRDRNSYLLVNLQDCKHTAAQISSFDSLTSDGGTWEVDGSTSDAINLTIDNTEYKEGNGCFNFDVDVSVSGNNRATIQNTALTSRDFTKYEDLASFIFRIYVPDVTYFSSITLRWGSGTSDYWSATATTDLNGNAFVDGWNRLKINWIDATATGTPDVADITYIRFDYNYGASQADDTDYRLDDLKLVLPERLTFLYTTWYVGQNNSGTEISAFTADTDVPFFSGQYDGYRYAVSHYAASLALYNLRLGDQAEKEETKAIQAFNRQKKMFPISKVKETKSFKPVGVNFRRGRYGGRR